MAQLVPRILGLLVQTTTLLQVRVVPLASTLRQQHVESLVLRLLDVGGRGALGLSVATLVSRAALLLVLAALLVPLLESFFLAALVGVQLVRVDEAVRVLHFVDLLVRVGNGLV